IGSKDRLTKNSQDHTVPDPGAPPITLFSHRIKWSLVTKEKVTTVLVALEGRVRITESYLDRVHLVGYPGTPTDATIRISELRSSDSGFYCCEVQHGIEDNHDIVHVQVQGKLKPVFMSVGLVFHYRAIMGRYSLTFEKAEAACSLNSAVIASPEQLQLYLAWQGGMDVCNAGWLGDRSVRYPINVRRPQCGGGLLGVRTVYLHNNQTGYPRSESRYDAFCYTGKIIFRQTSKVVKVIFCAQLACRSVGASIASPQQLQASYMAGYHQYDAGWLLDQTVRYPIISPRDNCAGDLGDQPGVRSYGLRPAEERYDVYCFIDGLKGKKTVYSVELSSLLRSCYFNFNEFKGAICNSDTLCLKWVLQSKF
uniref:Link domain-containing protein n=1 Tax=Labrus bergylta TaxID=56723 RepID=A0A3Q3FKX0_9LABR